jgi:hypothetical protein
MVTQGYGGILSAIVEGARYVIRLGKSGTRRALREIEEIVVWAKLIEVNDTPPPRKIEGFVRIGINRARSFAVALAESLNVRIRKTWEDVKVTVEMIRRRP